MNYQAMTRRKFKCTLLSERSQSKKTTYCMISTRRSSGKGKTMRTVKRAVVPGGTGKEGMNRQSTEDF